MTDQETLLELLCNTLEEQEGLGIKIKWTKDKEQFNKGYVFVDDGSEIIIYIVTVQEGEIHLK